MATTFSLAQLSEHNQKKDIYVAVHNKVYNVTSFIEEVSRGANLVLLLVILPIDSF
jgi:cytochrome b involved in lipid metabolism